MNNCDNPLVSIVIPTYSRNTSLKKAIQSALQQSYQNIEVVVVDDNPVESEWRKTTELIMLEYQHDPRVTYIKNASNLGGSGARNEGIKIAKGEYIAFLDDDDQYHSDNVKKKLECFRNTEQEKLALVFCDAVYTFDDDKFICDIKPRYSGCCLFEAMRDNCLAATSQWMATKAALLDVGMFTIVPCKQDSTLILKLLERGYQVECVPQILTKYCNYEGVRITGNGIKNLHGELAYKEKCERLYGRLSPEQIAEVDYSFQHRLLWLYMNNGQYKNAWKCFCIMVNRHPLGTVKSILLDSVRDGKKRIDRGQLKKKEKVESFV